MKFFNLFIFSVLILFSQNSFSAFSSQKIQTFLNVGDYEKAYVALEKTGTEHYGEPLFDEMIGQAAFLSGRFTNAIFALERAVEVSPQNINAQIMLGEALFQLSELDAAKEHWQTALSKKISEAQKNKINTLLKNLNKPQIFQKSALSKWLSFGTGYDSNINSATDISSIFIPSLTAVSNLTGNSLEQEAYFSKIATGLTYKKPLSKNLQLITRHRLSKRFNEGYSQFNQSQLNSSVGFVTPLQNSLLESGVNAALFSVDSSLYRKSLGLYGRWSKKISEEQWYGLSANIDKIIYPGQEIRDAKRLTVGANFNIATHAEFSPLYSLAAYVGTENTSKSTAKHIGYDFFSLQAKASYILSGDTKISTYAYFQRREHNASDPLFLKTREDDFLKLTANLEHKLSKGLFLTPSLSYIKNDSNLKFNEYDRVLGQVTIRKNF